MHYSATSAAILLLLRSSTSIRRAWVIVLLTICAPLEGNVSPLGDADLQECICQSSAILYKAVAEVWFFSHADVLQIRFTRSFFQFQMGFRRFRLVILDYDAFVMAF